ncbi:NUDIX hydrolase [Engelhardtia mirabilis]|uniref:NUDIX domain protein n=1 Tax=Engelhardtia mirabilis TaxID=2528011 RepID=A0A518BJI3_9BACT|nr:NUDIX domain protein [Planctomycetes bacterium Pla133]QDV01442.1 NUDIX domain protein [Planctomycetes bacterium Pla86]
MNDQSASSSEGSSHDPEEAARGQSERERCELARSRDTVASYSTDDLVQIAGRERILNFIDSNPDALYRTCRDGHLTASGLVIDRAGERGLLTLHRKLERWLQLGGHVDGDGDLATAALREAIEESGIDSLEVDPRVVDVDVHSIPAHGDEPEHLHLDVRFLLRAPEGARIDASSESIELRWVAPHELDEIEVDQSVRRLFDLAFGPNR